MGKLSQISETVQDIAEAIKAAFKVDVEIVDENIVRVAATSFAKDKIGQKMLYGTVSKYVISNNEPIIVDDIMKHELCKNCKGQGKCGYYGGVIVPVNYNNKTIGSINLVIYDKKLLCELLENKIGLIDFLYKMADLITSKLREKELLETEIQTSCVLKSIINTVPNGLILIDEDGIVRNINNRAERLLLRHGGGSFIGDTITDIFKDIPLDNVLSGNKLISFEISAEIGCDIIKYIADIKPVDGENNVLGALISFYPYDRMRKLAFEFGDSNKQISFDHIICKSKVMKDLKRKAKQFAKSSSTVLITGQSGTGKELFARAIHTESYRYDKPFVAVNCGAIPETLIESELFGYEKGAFTGANSRGKPGKFELANEGTIFLDEIGTMPIYLQAKLLRALENREIDKIGGSKPISVDVRIIAATNSNLEKMVQEGKFRQDLYYRLKVIPIEVPPLSERKGDILVLANYFVEKYNLLLNKNITRLSGEVEEILLSYRWLGNVRELENVIEYAINISPDNDEILEPKFLPHYIYNNPGDELPASYINTPEKLKILRVDQYERQAIDYLLKEKGNSTKAKEEIAAQLGMSKATLYRKIKEYRI